MKFSTAPRVLFDERSHSVWSCETPTCRGRATWNQKTHNWRHQTTISKNHIQVIRNKKCKTKYDQGRPKVLFFCESKYKSAQWNDWSARWINNNLQLDVSVSLFSNQHIEWLKEWIGHHTRLSGKCLYRHNSRDENVDEPSATHAHWTQRMDQSSRA